MPSIRLKNISWLIQQLLILLEVKSSPGYLLPRHFPSSTSSIYHDILAFLPLFISFGIQGPCAEDMTINMVEKGSLVCSRPCRSGLSRKPRDLVLNKYFPQSGIRLRAFQVQREWKDSLEHQQSVGGGALSTHASRDNH